MVSDNKSELDKLAIEVLKLIHDIIPWGEVPEDVRREKWRILARRVMASNAEDLQELINYVVRDIAGDIFYVKREREAKVLGVEIENLLGKVREKQNEKELLAYLKPRAIPLVIRLSARYKEIEKEER